jgi:hypothetical protein
MLRNKRSKREELKRIKTSKLKIRKRNEEIPRVLESKR